MDQDTEGLRVQDGVAAAVDTSVTGAVGELADSVVLEVSAPLQRLAARGGRAGAGERLRMPADRYMAAASRLVQEWSRIVPAAIETYEALAAGVVWPETLTPELLDVLLVHDHECLAARDRLRAKEAARTQDQQALRTRNVDQDLEAAETQAGIPGRDRVAHPHAGSAVAGMQAMTDREESEGSVTAPVREEPLEPGGPDR
ncbi:MAG: hypothetical protein ACYDB8_00665 [Acidiferrobacterales bacterium]